MQVVTRRGEQTIYREQIEFYTVSEGVKAVTRRGEGQEQMWDVMERPDGNTFVLLHGDHDGLGDMRLRWTIRRIGVDQLIS